VQTIDDLLWEDDAERVAKSANFELNH
jgi:hypothetical protein